MASLFGRVSNAYLGLVLSGVKIEKGGETSYKTIILFILMQIDDHVSILFILTPIQWLG